MMPINHNCESEVGAMKTITKGTVVIFFAVLLFWVTKPQLGIAEESPTGPGCETCVTVKQTHNSHTFGSVFDIKNNCALRARVWYSCEVDISSYNCKDSNACPNRFRGFVMSPTSEGGDSYTENCAMNSRLNMSCKFDETLSENLHRKETYRESTRFLDDLQAQKDFNRMLRRGEELAGVANTEEIQQEYQALLESIAKYRRELEAARSARELAVLEEREAEQQAWNNKRLAQIKAIQRNAQMMMAVTGALVQGMQAAQMASTGNYAGAGYYNMAMPNAQGFQATQNAQKYSPAQCSQIRQQIEEYNRCIREMDTQNRKGGYSSGQNQANAAYNAYLQGRQENQNLYNQYCR